MRIVAKIIAAPFVALLTVSWAVLVFLFCWAESILNIASVVSGLLAIVLFIIGQTTGGVVFAVIAFIISPLGLPLIVKWLIDRLGELNSKLRCFITS